MYDMDDEGGGWRPDVRCSHHRKAWASIPARTSSAIRNLSLSINKVSSSCAARMSLFLWDRIQRCTTWLKNIQRSRAAVRIHSLIQPVSLRKSQFRKTHSRTSSSGSKLKGRLRRGAARAEDRTSNLRFVKFQFCFRKRFSSTRSSCKLPPLLVFKRPTHSMSYSGSPARNAADCGDWPW